MLLFFCRRRATAMNGYAPSTSSGGRYPALHSMYDLFFIFFVVGHLLTSSFRRFSLVTFVFPSIYILAYPWLRVVITFWFAPHHRRIRAPLFKCPRSGNLPGWPCLGKTGGGIRRWTRGSLRRRRGGTTAGDPAERVCVLDGYHLSHDADGHRVKRIRSFLLHLLQFFVGDQHVPRGKLYLQRLFIVVPFVLSCFLFDLFSSCCRRRKKGKITSVSKAC